MSKGLMTTKRRMPEEATLARDAREDAVRAVRRMARAMVGQIDAAGLRGRRADELAHTLIVGAALGITELPEDRNTLETLSHLRRIIALVVTPRGMSGLRDVAGRAE